jgi:chromosome segregation ATPase
LDPANTGQARIDEIFNSFGKAWLKYWESYVALQDQLYESLRAAREVQWLAATDTTKLSEINALQRELFASMPRRLDYTPLGQISRDLDSAPTRIAELEAALASETEDCKRLEAALEVLKKQTQVLKESLTPGRR